MSKVIGSVVFAGVCAGLVAGWIALFQTHEPPPAALDAQVEPDVLLIRIKELDSTWNTEVLKTQIDVNRSYDPLVRPFLELVDLRNQLVSLNHDVQEPATVAAVEGVSRAIDEKALLVDRYKSTHSLLKNSMRYIPTVQRDVRNGSITELIGDLLRYNAAPETEIASSLSLRVSVLRNEAMAMPEPQKEQTLNLLSHIRTVVNERPRTHDAIDRIMRIQVASQADSLREIYAGQVRGRTSSTASSRDTWMAMYALVAAVIVGVGAALLASPRRKR